MSNIDYDVRVKAIEVEQENGRVSEPARMIQVKFHRLKIVRFYPSPPTADYDGIGYESRELISKRSIHVPASNLPLDQALAQKRALEVINNMRIPEHVKDEILEELLSVLEEKISASSNAVSGTRIVIVVGIALVKWQGLNNRQFEDLIIRRAEMQSMEDKAKPIPASKESIEALETVAFDELKECVVCMAEIETGTEGIRMPCLHFYHQDCIKKWLQSSRVCPLCRYEMLPEQEQ
ncbi:hypothetical protein JCGZ_11589 [Jatropha curcas]|uniref:RING-type E3 ubiquitin transferase n=1 Tax=Jatropha curcas TaxID=180498 RepID=A0A067K8A6_JATCU|nr:E3 ubiquitin-protein ligase Praja-1 [Jatropha curcas]KDP31213.1 hypothetical protein JCGZ_11589 [Jatropha curcas]